MVSTLKPGRLRESRCLRFAYELTGRNIFTSFLVGRLRFGRKLKPVQQVREQNPRPNLDMQVLVLSDA